MKYLLIILILLPVYADSIILHSKLEMHGKIISENKHEIKMRCFGNNITIKKTLISKIKRSKESSEYIRYSDVNETTSVLETKVTSFSFNGKIISLVGVLHIADKGYYRTLENVLDVHDIVLYEGVGTQTKEDLSKWNPPKRITFEAEPKPLKVTKPISTQRALANLFQLEYQLDCMNYFKSYWKPADMSEEEMNKKLLERASDRNKLDNIQKIQDRYDEMYIHLLANLITQIVSEDTLRNRGKKILAKFLAEDFLSDKESLDPYTYVLLVDRNDKAFSILEQAMKNDKLKSISLFYGVTHMKDLEDRLKKKGAVLDSVDWFTAWNITN